MDGSNLGKNEEKQEEKIKKLPKRAYRKIGIFVGFLLVIMTIVPTYELKAAATSNQAEITLTAIVPFRSEFAEAVAKNSKISFDRTILFAEREAEGRITFSNGETILKNQKFVCQIVDRKGKTEISYVGQSGKDGIGHFAFKVSTEMAGENFIRCWATGYEKDIIVEQQINFFVLPKASDALNFFIN